MNFADFKDINDFYNKTGMTRQEASIYLLEKLKEKDIMSSTGDKDFEDYCTKNNMTLAEGFRFLDGEVEKRKQQKFDINDHPEVKKFLEDTGMSLDQAVVWLDIKIKNFKKK